MLIALILAHPGGASFNAAIAGTARQVLADLGHRVQLHDFYAEGFDPLLSAAEIPRQAVLPASITAHCQELA
ncbi:hypothetical protein DFAR_1700003 [Desulfarculales bacterium]